MEWSISALPLAERERKESIPLEPTGAFRLILERANVMAKNINEVWKVLGQDPIGVNL